MTNQQLLSCLDFTNLAVDLPVQTIDDLCQKAQTYQVAAVCVQKQYIRHCSEILGDSSVLVASVFSFPEGDQPLKIIMQDIDRSLADGVNECDIVIPLKTLASIHDISHFQDTITTFVESLRSTFPRENATLKFILATDVLQTKDKIQAATKAVVEGGGDFVKTCTGQHGGGATLQVLQWMLDTIQTNNSQIGLKASGGVKTVAFAKDLFQLVQSYHQQPLTVQQFRIGASSLLDELV